MNKRTFEIIARFISIEHGIKVVYGDVPGPCISLDDKTIRLPESIKEENALSALSSLMHEAAHMRYSTVIPKDFSKSNIDHHIVNAIEDVRIDRHNFNLLPNVRGFYDQFVKDHICTKEYREKLMKNHIFTRTMIYCILECEYYNRQNRWDKEAHELATNHHLVDLFGYGVHYIERNNWVKLREVVDAIKSKFNFKKNEEKKQQPNGGKNGECKTAKAGEAKEAEGAGGEPKKASSGSEDKGKDVLTDPSKLMRPSSVWGKGGGLAGPGGVEFSSAELEEITKRRFKEALNITERQVIDDGMQLNTDSIINYFVGEADELFSEEEEIKTKNSKIVFCLDCSGSMANQLMDGCTRRKALATCVQSLINVLDEVKETDSLSVDYDIVAFDHRVYPLDKDTWMSEYFSHSGGTRLIGGVKAGVDLLLDPGIDGNRILIVVTDGCVSPGDIEATREVITKNCGEIKAMMLGIGARIGKEKLLNGNILFQEHADQILMEAIQTALEV